jgi:uncharacterized membrane protein YeaQ/YmgE (transglycosylase-associated protein family)
MNFTNFIIWLTAGAIVGWFASKMVEAERKRIVRVIPASASD